MSAVDPLLTLLLIIKINYSFLCPQNDKKKWPLIRRKQEKHYIAIFSIQIERILITEKEAGQACKWYKGGLK